MTLYLDKESRLHDTMRYPEACGNRLCQVCGVSDGDMIAEVAGFTRMPEGACIRYTVMVTGFLTSDFADHLGSAVKDWTLQAGVDKALHVQVVPYFTMEEENANGN